MSDEGPRQRIEKGYLPPAAPAKQPADAVRGYIPPKPPPAKPPPAKPPPAKPPAKPKG